MSNFKKVLDIERKFNHSISSAQKEYEKKLEKFNEELLDKEEATKRDYRKELGRELKKKITFLKEQGELEVLSAKEKAQRIQDNAQKEEAITFLLEEVKNV